MWKWPPMNQRASQPRLGDEYLGDSRHICALFDGPDAESKALFPFVVDGLQFGDRVVWLSEDRQDTHDRLVEAVGMYRGAGYREVPDFNANPRSNAWFEKPLA